MLSKLGLVSAITTFSARNKAPRPPDHWTENRSFHIDYCFTPEAWTADIRSVSVGSYADWSGSSDHRPLVVKLSKPDVRCP